MPDCPMNKVLLGLGSNVEPQKHMQRGLQAIAELDADYVVSPVYQSPAVGFDGDDFCRPSGSNGDAPKGLFVDVGAHVGFFTMYAAGLGNQACTSTC